jgi:hypothetical protein
MRRWRGAGAVGGTVHMVMVMVMVISFIELESFLRIQAPGAEFTIDGGLS